MSMRGASEMFRLRFALLNMTERRICKQVLISMYAKLDDTLAVGGAASLRHTVTWVLNACDMARIVNVPQDAAPPMTARSCIN